MKRTEMPPRSAPMRRTPLKVSAPVRKRREETCKQSPRIRWRKDTIPPRVRGQVDVRDSTDEARCCVLCGLTGVTLHRHHRRLKGIGGDKRAHTDCACNIITLCSGCHYWAHVIGRYDAEAEGFIIPSCTPFPGAVSVLVHGKGDAGGIKAWPTCAGDWVFRAPGKLAAA